MAGEPNTLAEPYKPLGGVILIPFDRVSVVHWELMVEIVITLSDRDQGGEDVVSRGVFIVKRRLAEPMRK
jgi:hypothetical protein